MKIVKIVKIKKQELSFLLTAFFGSRFVLRRSSSAQRKYISLPREEAARGFVCMIVQRYPFYLAIRIRFVLSVLVSSYE